MDMTKEYVNHMLMKENSWKDGDANIFYSTLSQKWKFILQKENCSPYTYILIGEKIGTNERWTRRYKTIEEAFLHIVNNLNENMAVKNKYQNIREWLFSE